MKKILHLLATLSVIGIISGGVLSELNAWALPKIAHNREVETKAAISEVQPLTVNSKRLDIKEMEVYSLTDKDGNDIGYAIVHEGTGFQGTIRLIIGIKPDLEEIVGLKILEQVETPGLGTKVTEMPFLKQFEGLQTQPEITWVKGEAPDADNEIQAITGATISSKAVVNIVNNGIETFSSLKN